jgi:hypothetical protein
LPIPGTAEKQLMNWRQRVKWHLRGKSFPNDAANNYRWIKMASRRGLLDIVITSTAYGCRFLHEQGIPAHFIPLGYHSVFGGDLQLERDVDVLWLGGMTIYRRRYLNRLGKELRVRGVKFLDRRGYQKGVWGEERTRLLNRAKVMPHICAIPPQFPGLRFVLGAANKALIISEPVYDSSPFIPGKHFVVGPVEALPDLIDYYLQHEDERLAIVNEAYTFVTQEHTMHRSVTRLLELITSQELTP